MNFRLLLGLLGCVLALNCSAGVYKWVDANGKTHYGDREPTDQSAKQIAIKVNTVTGPPQIEQSTAGSAGMPKAATLKPEVWIYSAVWCGVCTEAKKYFSARGVPYRELDVDKSAQAKADFQSLGGRGVPLIFIGQTRVSGFSQATVEPLLRSVGY